MPNWTHNDYYTDAEWRDIQTRRKQEQAKMVTIGEPQMSMTETEREEFHGFLGDLVYWLTKHDLEAKVVVPADPREVTVELFAEGEAYYVGPSAMPHLRVKWYGTHKLPQRQFNGGEVTLVECNGVAFEAIARAIAGWVIGYE